MTTLAGKKADFYITSGAAVALTNEPMSDITANFPANPAQPARTVYAVTNQARRYFDPATALVFERSLNSGGSWATVVPDNIDAGLISFVASQQSSPAAMFRVSSGKYLPYSRMGGGHEWALSAAMDIIDVTEFGHTSKHHLVSISGGQVAVKRWWYDDTLRAVLGGLMVVVLYVDATAQPAAPRYEALAMLRGDAIKTAMRAAIEEDLTFELQSDISFLSS